VYNMTVVMKARQLQQTSSDSDLESDLTVEEPEITWWENDHNQVHVILTRFMQHQPDLLHLGRARLELFKSFCLPTMRKQTSRQFLWIIRADPKLHPILKAEFLNTLKGMNSVVVVGSNARIDDGHFRHENSIADINESTLWLGNLEIVQAYHRAAQTSLVLETGLDADDGLDIDFVSDIQIATANVAETQKKLGVNSWWKIWCVKKSTEWQFYGDYLNSRYGHMREVGAELKLCITPGLTRVSTPDYRTWKESQGKQKGGDLAKEGYRFFVDHFYIQTHSAKKYDQGVGGWTFIPGRETRAVRARTPTSAGMKNIVKLEDSSRPMEQHEQDPWFRTIQMFGLSMNAIRRSRDKMVNNLALILEDAIAGQCSEGHSCKEKSAKMLSELRQEAQRQRKG
jgi:hypothetical protein